MFCTQENSFELPLPPAFPLFVSNRYAALDAYASFLLYGRIVELSEPIFADAKELHAGNYVRLYTRGGNDCVEEGHIVEYPEEAWETTGVVISPRCSTRGLTRRWVVRLIKVHVHGAETLYPNESDNLHTQATVHVGDRNDQLLLWNAGRLRKVAFNAGAATSGHTAVDRGGVNPALGSPSVAPSGDGGAVGVNASGVSPEMPPYAPAAAIPMTSSDVGGGVYSFLAWP